MSDVLRPVATADLTELVAFSARNLACLRPHVVLPESAAQWSACLDDRSGTRWFVYRRDARIVAVGVLARITGPPWMSAEVGVGVDGDSRRRGIGAGALRAIFRAELGTRLHRIEALVEPGNTASARMVAAAGMRAEGISRAVLEIGGTRRDMTRWAVTSSDT